MSNRHWGRSLVGISILILMVVALPASAAREDDADVAALKSPDDKLQAAAREHLDRKRGQPTLLA